MGQKFYGSTYEEHRAAFKFDRPNQLPVVGPWIGRIGRVQQILSNPCAATPEIWVRAFFRAAPTAIFSYIKPTPTDYLIGRFGLPHQRRKPKFSTNVGHMLKGIPVTGPIGQALFKGLMLQQRIGNYMLIADIASEFAVNWVSMAYQLGGCNDPTAPYCQMTTTGMPVVNPAPITFIYHAWIPQNQQGYVGDFSGIATSAGTDPMVGCTLSSVPQTFAPGQPDASWSATIINGFGGPNVEMETSARQNGNRYAIGTWLRDSLIETGGSFLVQVTKGSGYIQFSGGNFSAHGRNMRDVHSLGPDP